MNTVENENVSMPYKRDKTFLPDPGPLHISPDL